MLLKIISISASYFKWAFTFSKYQLPLYLNTRPPFIIVSHSRVISVTSHTLPFHCSGIKTSEIFQWSRMTSVPSNWRGVFFNKTCNFVPKEGPIFIQIATYIKIDTIYLIELLEISYCSVIESSVLKCGVINFRTTWKVHFIWVWTAVHNKQLVFVYVKFGTEIDDRKLTNWCSTIFLVQTILD
jgi:hypothetical protein